MVQPGLRQRALHGGPRPATVGYVPMFDDKARGAWTAFVRALAEHFRDRVEHWEIWNEPNIKNFWQPKRPDPDDYVDS